MRKILVVLFGLALIVILYVLAQGNLTNKEMTLFSTALAVLAIGFSWLITDIYSQQSKEDALDKAKKSYQDNLKTYVINASEKVNNISNELSKLSQYLKEINKIHSKSDSIEVQLMSERLNSSTHIIESLKSVNDTTINDWKGIIGEDIKTFTEKEKEEKKKEIDNLKLKIENLEKMGNDTDPSIQDARILLDNLLSDEGIVLNEEKKIQHITRSCPNCFTNLGYDQHTRNKNTRKIHCSSHKCGSLLISEYDDLENKFTLYKPDIKNIDVICKNCSKSISFELPTFEGSSEKHLCSCSNNIVLKYIDNNIEEHQSVEGNVKITIDEELVEKVLHLLPEQPWEKGMHHIIAEKLNLPSSRISKVIKLLIYDGKVYDQRDGELFKRVKVT